MARDPRGAPGSGGRRTERRTVSDPDAQERIRIAQVAARLIAEHGIADWSLAKRKAARQLGLPDRAAFPGDDEIASALVDYHAIFGGEAHRVSLREKREEASRWMRRLVAFRPLLVGGVAAGWATLHSDIRIDLVADDSKTVELALLNAQCEYRHAPSRHPDDPAELCVDSPAGTVRLRVRTPQAARQLPRRDRHGNDELRLDLSAVTALLDANADPA